MSYEPDPDAFYRCPDCEEFSKGWVESEVGCEDCGSHPGMTCPVCDWRVDLIYNELDDLEVEEE